MLRSVFLPVVLLLALLGSVCSPVPAVAVPLPAGPEGLPAGVLPVPGPVVTDFRPPPEPWLPGHRGVDLAATPGEAVQAAAPGFVTYAGSIAGRGVVVVSHGALRTTYEPVTAQVEVGRHVVSGETLGTLQPGHPSCAPVSCLHWGLRRAEEYLNPMLLPVGPAGAAVRLVGEAEVGAARRAAEQRVAAREAARLLAATAASPGPAGGADAGGGGSGWVSPVRGPLTSPFGMRVHPVTGVYKLHDGVDYGAPCGAPIRTALAGTVTELDQHPAYGWRARVDHGTVNGRRLVTSYNHARSYSVRAGQQVGAGQVIGSVGSTGWSTGCHLHLMAWQDGTLVDPTGLG